jgi:hypothetical protein
MLNPFFLQGSKTEQGLIQDLINEHLKIYGIDVYYLPRQYVTEKTIIKEVIESEFNSAYPIEAYIDSYDGYGGQGTILSKFGIQELDDLNIIISKERYESYISPLIKDLPNVKLSSRPKEGDLIYFPLGDRLFEIKYVEHEKPFYQLQKNYVYELRCELFRYGDEVIGTGINEIDDEVSEDGYIQTLQLIGIGATATAQCSIVNGGVRFVTITNRGTGYKSKPDVSFSAAPTTGLTAVGIASMISNIVDFCEGDKNLYRVQSVELLESGYGYTSAPMVSFIGGGGSGAKGVATIGNGIVGIITVTNGGSGYVNPPDVFFTGISSESARGVAILNDSGTVIRINITNAGLGYSNPPSISISSPTINVGSGAYIYNEPIVGSASSARARVRSWNVNTKILEVGNINGDFIPGETLVGQKSNARYVLKVLNTNNLRDANDSLNIADKYAQNEQIEIEGDAIIDFSDQNPFGMP